MPQVLKNSISTSPEFTKVHKHLIHFPPFFLWIGHTGRVCLALWIYSCKQKVQYSCKQMNPFEVTEVWPTDRSAPLNASTDPLKTKVNMGQSWLYVWPHTDTLYIIRDTYTPGRPVLCWYCVLGQRKLTADWSVPAPRRLLCDQQKATGGWKSRVLPAGLLLIKW